MSEEHVVANPHDDDMLHHKPKPISILDESIGILVTVYVVASYTR